MFVLIDFILFKLMRGRYSIESKRRRYPINLSWEGAYEPVLEQILHMGDIIFFSNKYSKLSWLVQYITKTDISHIGVYLGEGKVLHATLSGTRIDHLRELFDRGFDVMPVSMQSVEGIADIQTKNVSNDHSEYVGIKYALGSVILRGILILIGIPWRKFRLTYISDVMLMSLLISYLAAGEYFYALFVLSFMFYLLLVLIAFIYRKRLRIPVFDPGEGFYNLPRESYFIPSVKKMNEEWFLKYFREATK